MEKLQIINKRMKLPKIKFKIGLKLADKAENIAKREIPINCCWRE